MSEVKLNERQDVKAVLGPTTAHSSCPKANKISTLYKTTVIQNRDHRTISFYLTESGIATDYQPWNCLETQGSVHFGNMFCFVY